MGNAERFGRKVPVNRSIHLILLRAFMNLPTSQKKLLRLLSNGRFRSGNILAEELGISRASVWKQIGKIAGSGIAIEAVSGRGYRLVRPLELLDETAIRSWLRTEVDERIGAFYLHDRIDSTNSFLSSGSFGPELNGVICLAESQSAGKGRIGRTWISPFGNNVYLSLAWRYASGPGNLSGLSLAVGVAVVRALRTLNVGGVGLKWPNDILWHGKKLGGILIELSGDAHGPCTAVIGLGLNVEMSREEGAAIAQEWVDLDTITGHSKPGRNRLVGTLINEILPVAAEFDQTGLAPFLDEWRSLDCLRGEEVVLHSGNRTIVGKVAGINGDGRIQLCSSDGDLRSYAAGEVSLRAILV
jgi:BirA family transcriptional regulator, biotin operon repressor / biotin---[acetyl-CoA-carboxylase] ligase